MQEHFFCHLEENPAAMVFGWFGYGMGASADQEKKLPYRPSATPDAYWQRCAIVFTFNHSQSVLIVHIDPKANAACG